MADPKLQSFIEKINSIKLKYFQSQSLIDLAVFTKLLKEIQQYDSTLEVTEENTSEIFNMLDHDYDGLLSLSEVDQLLTTILPAYEESLNPMQNEDNNSNRGSLYFDISQKRFTYARTKMPDADKHKIGSSVLNSLSLDKISELKYIYQMADRESKGFAEFERIRSIGREMMNQLSLSPDEIEACFSAFNDEKTNKVSSEIFARLLSELEKRIFNYYNGSQEENQSVKVEKMTSQLDLMIQDSESDNEGKEEYQIREVYSTISAKYISLLVQKLEEAFGLKIKNQFLTNILQDLRKVIKSLENKLLHAEDKIDGFIKVYQEAKSAQDHSVTKMKAMEFDLKRQICMTETFEDEISKMDLEIKRLEDKTTRLEKTNQVLSKRTQDIEILETRIRALIKENQELKDKMSSLNKEKSIALENYQLLSQMKERSYLVTEAAEAQQRDSSKYLEIKLEQSEKNREIFETMYKMKEKELLSVSREKELLEEELRSLKVEFEQNEHVIISTKNELRDLKETYNSLKEDYDLKLEYLQNRSKSPEGSFIERKSSFSQGFTLNKDLNLKGNSNDFASIFNERASLYSRFQKNSLAPIDEADEEKGNKPKQSVFKKRLERPTFIEPSYEEDKQGFTQKKEEDNKEDGGKKVEVKEERGGEESWGEKKMEGKTKWGGEEEWSEKKAGDEENLEGKIIGDSFARGTFGVSESSKMEESKVQIKNEKSVSVEENNQGKKQEKGKENIIKAEVAEKKKVENAFFEKIDTGSPSTSPQNQANPMKNNEAKATSVFKDAEMKTQKPELQKKESEQKNKEQSTTKEQPKDNKSKEQEQKNKTYSKTDPEYKFLQFDEASLFARDYLSLREDPRILEILRKNNEDMLNFSCFSDYMFRINHREHKEKRILFMTARNFYNIHPKRFEVLRKVPIEKIFKTSISDKSAFLIAVHFKNEYDYLIETYRRADMVLFLMETFKKRGLPMFDRAFGPQFSIKNRDSSSSKPISQYSQAKASVGMQEIYKNSMKIGLLEMQRNSWWNPWKEYFFVLMKDLGLMVFRNQGDSNTRNIIKITGSLIVEKPSGIDKPYALKITYPENNEEYVLAAHSFAEKTEWIEAFHKFQREAEKRKKLQV